MTQNVQEELSALLGKDTWTVDDQRALQKALLQSREPVRVLRETIRQVESGNADLKGTAALKVGIARYMLCQYREALDVLSSATDNKERRYFQGLCAKHLRDYDRAATEFGMARDRGLSDADAAAELAECEALRGKTDEAGKQLAALQKREGETGRVWYLRGLLAEVTGDGDGAVKAYDKARQADPSNGAVLFRLAYYLDLHGNEEEAIELYKECLNHPPVYANALMNLAVLYEDDGQYEQAERCLRRMLGINPNHPRAKLFLKDVEASMGMYYDEDRAKRIARRNAVLDIPVTDFELSVRARNCLKKMNIRTLGDLVRTTEPELLGYKNFGETSLKEIKDMLSAKGLTLGQPIEEEEEGELVGLISPTGPKPSSVANEGVLALPVAQIDFSIRARKALENLNIQTLGDLASRSEPELLACRNFGQTSLNEVRQRLSEYGLRLREP